MVFMRDRSSLSGTWVNGLCIGSKKRTNSPGYLLSHGDTIRIEPYWEFEVRIASDGECHQPLTEIQCIEARLFENVYLISDRRISSGSWSKIHLAQETKTGRQVICKICDLDAVRSTEHSVLGTEHDVRQLVNEPEVMGKVRHVCFRESLCYRQTLIVASPISSPWNLHIVRSIQCTRSPSLPPAETYFL
jgi:hypothetical protein